MPRSLADCGAYLYTASATERNLFRSTAYHNTPRIDGQEMNRFIAWNALWNLRYDALPELRTWDAGPDRAEFEGAHGGYRKLAEPVVPVRRIILDHASHSLTITRCIRGFWRARIRLKFRCISIQVWKRSKLAPNRARLTSAGKSFEVVWSDPAAWALPVSKRRASRAVTGWSRGRGS